MSSSPHMRYLFVISAYNDYLYFEGETCEMTIICVSIGIHIRLSEPLIGAPLFGYSRRISRPPPRFCTYSNCITSVIWFRARGTIYSNCTTGDIRFRAKGVTFSNCTTGLIRFRADGPTRWQPFVVDTRRAYLELFCYYEPSSCPSSSKPPWSSLEYSLENYRFAYSLSLLI